MSTQESAPGFSNRWYEGGDPDSDAGSLPSGKVIRLIASLFFLGTKMEVFYDRGKNDYYMSHDLEDFIAVVEGREQLLEELGGAPDNIRKYLGKATSKLLG